MTMQHASVPVLGFAANSGTGKTTLLTKLIPILKNQGLRIGLIKHSHHDFEIDYPNKDSFRLRKAGASSVLLVSPYREVLIHERDANQIVSLAEQLERINQNSVDLILIEGFKAETIPKIELHRQQLNQPLLYPNDPYIIAIASDTVLNIPDYLTQLDLNRPELIADFILTLL